MKPSVMRTAVALLVLSCACWLRASDTVLVSGHIYTGNPRQPWAQAVAISAGRIDAVGSDADILKHRDAKTTVIQLDGRTVIPGITDSHTHMWFGAMALHGFNLSTPEASVTDGNPEALVAAIRSYAAAHPADKILFGRADFSTTPPTMSTKDVLDQAVNDRPVIIHSTWEHSLWMNSKALAMAGLTDEPVPNPEEEKYVVRDAGGHPTGLLLEAAMEIAERAVNREIPRQQKLAWLHQASLYLNRYGITSVVNATGSLAEIELYAALRESGQLTVRTRTAFGAVAYNHRLTEGFLKDLEEARSRYHDPWVSANLVKFFADGGTGAVPPLTYVPADYRRLVLELDKRGYQLMSHTLRGDSAHLVLDAYEAAARANGPRDRRLRMEHADILLPSDLGRFASIPVIASMQPSVCCSDNGTNFDPREKSPTDRWQSLRSSGATLAFGSDWPCTWPPDPFVGIAESAMRTVWVPAGSEGFPGGQFDGAAQAGNRAGTAVYAPEERLTVQQAVDAYTAGSAYANFTEKNAGTLETGKFADLVVLSQDIFSVPPEKIAATQAVLTMVDGRVVYRKD